jgi:hypothetical protein
MSDGSMMGSGIYSQEVSREIVCREMCFDCVDQKKECDAVWDEDFPTDDWGNIEETVKCEKCGHSYEFKEER